MTRTCTIEDCHRNHYGRGLCAPHWKRWKRHGDPAAGRTPPGAGLALIEAAIASDSDDCILWPFGTRTGYGRIQVDGAERMAHRLVLEAHSGPPPDADMVAAHAPVVCHNRACINPRHLRWASVAENHADRILDDTHRRGERTPGSKLTEVQVIKIRKDTRKQCVIAKDYDVSEASISLIKSGKNWGWLGEAVEGVA